MPEQPILSAIQREVVAATAWKAMLPKLVIVVLVDIVFTLSVSLGATFITSAAVRSSDRHHAQVACHNTATLAKIQRTTVDANAAQTKDLEKTGFTFGIPKARFDKLAARSQAQQDQQLKALDALARANCVG